MTSKSATENTELTLRLNTKMLFVVESIIYKYYKETHIYFLLSYIGI